jgi:hypothetical protein
MITARIDELFHIVYGQKEYHNKEWLDGDIGSSILISSKGEDNGIYGFFSIENKFKAPFITVQGYGTIGQAFVQEKDCSVDDHLLVLQPIKSMDMHTMYQVAYQIRALKWKYRYGRGITPTRLGAEIVIIEDFKKDWPKFEKSLMPSESRQKKLLVENHNIKWRKVSELCDIDRKYFYYMNEVNGDEEKTPYITTTEKNNGVSILCGEDAINEPETLTIALDGKCGEAFYQTVPYVSGEKTAILNHENKYLLMYVGACIKILSWKFHYGRKLSMTRLKEMTVPIPYKGNEIDLEYIESVVKNSYAFDNLASDLQPA